jgi:glycosyltransferase involved in cell wall biosynthesis
MAQPRLVIVCAPGHTRFVEETAHRLAASGNFEVRICFSVDPEEIRAAVVSADIVWLEWANELTVQITNKLHVLLEARRVIVRLHSYELFTGIADAVRWDVVDDVIFVGSHIRDLARQFCPAILDQVERVHVIPNGINLDRFPLIERDGAAPPAKSLAFVANLSFKKGPMLLMHAFKALVDADPGFRLFMAGEIQQPRFALYVDHLVRTWDLERNLKFEGHVEDISGWLADKDMIVCTSPIEGQGLGILEAAARGLKPLVHYFVGAEQVYPESWLWSSIDEFVAMALEGRGEPSTYRAFVAERYSKDREMEATRAMLLGAPRS